MERLSKYFQFRFFIAGAGRQFGAQSLLLFLLLLLTASCKKYLDAKPDKKLVEPSSVQDLQGILDWSYYMSDFVCSEASEIASDNYYLTDATYSSFSNDRNRNAYLWKAEIFNGLSPTDWQSLYNIVFNSNVVLDKIDNILRNSANAVAWDNCKGSAFVFRAKSFYEIAQIWAKAYDSSSAHTDLGIPLRLTPDFNAKTVRSTIKETYDQIINDLKHSISLLPNTPQHPFRPSKGAAYGLLSRTYLILKNYNQAKLYADSALQINNSLIDYNTLNPNLQYPFENIQFSNPEDIMHSSCVINNYNLYFTYGRIDTLLYESYDSNDLRKTIFFKLNNDNSAYFRGSYDGRDINYNGIATDEIYLIRAECLARAGDANSALSDLNKLLVKRWKTGTFTPLIATNSTDALNTILIERRKELIFRMLRLSDIKRLNKDGANITLKRIVQGQTYILPPNDDRYALPIPIEVIQYSGIQQN